MPTLKASRPVVIKKEDCLKVSTIYGHGSHLGHVTSTKIHVHKISFPHHQKAAYETKSKLVQ